MAVAEERPSYEDPEFDPETERLNLLYELRSTVRENGQGEVARTIWHRDAKNGYMAILCGGYQEITEQHSHFIGLAFVVALGSGDASYRLYSQCPNVGSAMYPLTLLDAYDPPIPTDPQETSRDVYAHYALTHTEFTPGPSTQFKDVFRATYPYGESDPSVGVLLDEDPGLRNWQLYGEFLIEHVREASPPPVQ
jgi:hypothetical protein